MVFQLIDRHLDTLLMDWLKCQRRDGTMSETSGLQDQTLVHAQRFLVELRAGEMFAHDKSFRIAAWPAMQALLDEVSATRAFEGYTPTQTASFVFSIKEPVYNLLRTELAADPDRLTEQTLGIFGIIDKLGLYTFEAYQRTREEIIRRQQQELLELSTPVVELWKGILALPLIGTLDSSRTQIVMENLLERIVQSEAEIAIIDITGVPTVDTLVAQHLIKTVSAARLMGADCIISGIRPQIAQTMVHLGVELNVVSKATIADALALALRRMGRTVTECVPHEGRAL